MGIRYKEGGDEREGTLVLKHFQIIPQFFQSPINSQSIFLAFTFSTKLRQEN
jgi:hypothetical protein